ncbi:hypothetical protein RCH06_001866 [Polaromonas sp. CG_9.5]|uniref:DUF4468 domain-containing protein n=1 Tax=Polaromonas sp. CG_9.5 TaxID=3071705 RepID=UPI002DFCF364|nr:hypothetical protein [Polaromonas sp. CG_9.5]
MHILILAGAIFLTGCVTVQPQQLPITTEQREFIYDYPAPGKSQKELFTSARNYLALSYGNSKAVNRVEDEKEGTIIGKAVANWNLSTGSVMIPSIPCASNYDIIFIAKDGKARLQLTLVDGKAIASCGWASPPKQDYPQIVSEFNAIAESMGKALKNDSAVDRLKNF